MTTKLILLALTLLACAEVHAQTTTSTARAIIQSATFPSTCRSGQVLVKTGSLPGLYLCAEGGNVWAEVPRARRARSVSASTTATFTDGTIRASASAAALTVTLPSAVGIENRRFTIKRTSTNAFNVVVAATNSQTIDGATSYVISTAMGAVTVESDGANWLVIMKF